MCPMCPKRGGGWMRQTYYRVCELCGAHLDPSEKCDCQDQKGMGKCNQHFIRNISDPQRGRKRKNSEWRLMASGVSCVGDP